MHARFRTALFLLLLLAASVRGELRVEGVSDDIARNVETFVGLAAEPCDADSQVIRRRFRKVEAEAKSALEPFGYYSPKIEKTLSFDDSCWTAILLIDPANAVILRNTDIAI